MDPPVVSVVVPTRGRAAYLEVTLDSLLDQRAAVEHEVLVVDDGDDRATAEAVPARPLGRAAYARGRGARAGDRRRGQAPSLAGELRVLAGCGWHTVRRACPQGLVMGAHSAGRVVETLRGRWAASPRRGRSPPAGT